MNRDTICISVVIPLYNKASHVRRALESVLAQTHPDFEVIVVDDGSTDGGADVVKGIQDPRVKLVTQVNMGVSAARNRGIESSSSELVAFLDADDEWMPEFLDTILGLRTRFPQSGAYATAYQLQEPEGARVTPLFREVPADPAGGLLKDYFLAALSCQPVCSSAVAIPKDVLRAVRGFPLGMTMGEDLDTWARIAFHYPIAWSPRAMSVYHREADNRACRRLNIGDIAFAGTIEEHIERRDIPDDMSNNAREYLAKFQIEYAASNWIAGETHVARLLLRKSESTKMFRRRWLYWRVVTLFPQPLTILAWRIRRRLTGRTPNIARSRIL